MGYLRVVDKVYIGAQEPDEAEDKAGGLAKISFFKVNDVAGLVQLFDRFVREKMAIKYLSMHSHGSCGSFAFPKGESLSIGELERFRNRGFHTIFAPGATIRFWSCKMAQDARGELFMGELAKILLKDGGGEVHGSADNCFYDTIKGLWSNNVVSCDGRQVVAQFDPKSHRVTYRNHRYLSADRIRSAIAFLRLILEVKKNPAALKLHGGAVWDRYQPKPPDWQRPAQGQSANGMARGQIDILLGLLAGAESMVAGETPELMVLFAAVNQVELVAQKVPQTRAW